MANGEGRNRRNPDLLITWLTLSLRQSVSDFSHHVPVTCSLWPDLAVSLLLSSHLLYLCTCFYPRGIRHHVPATKHLNHHQGWETAPSPELLSIPLSKLLQQPQLLHQHLLEDLKQGFKTGMWWQAQLPAMSVWLLAWGLHGLLCGARPCEYIVLWRKLSASTRNEVNYRIIEYTELAILTPVCLCALLFSILKSKKQTVPHKAVGIVLPCN